MCVQFLYDRGQICKHVSHRERSPDGDHDAAGLVVGRHEERQLEDVVDERREQNVFGVQFRHVTDGRKVAQTTVVLFDHSRFGSEGRKAQKYTFIIRYDWCTAGSVGNGGSEPQNLGNLADVRISEIRGARQPITERI